MLIPPVENILQNPKKYLSPIFIKNNYNEFYNFLIKSYPNLKKISEMMYWYYNNLQNYHTCKTCGKILSKYRGFNVGYGEYCSPKCVAKSKLVQKKIKKTKKDIYGDENYNNRPKASSTYAERYDVDNPFKSKEIQQKIKNTNLQKYGVEFPSQSQTIRFKTISTWMNKYGVDHPMKAEEIKSKVLNNALKYNIANDDELIGYTKDCQRIMKCPHPECNKCDEKYFIIPGINYFARREYNIELCTRLLPVKLGKNSNTQIELFVQKLLDEHNIEYVCNVRNILKSKELDIYIPSKKLAIECNGCYWHSYPRKTKNYHINKYKECRQLGIKLIQIWEDQVINTPEIVKSVILSKLGIYQNRIYARKCTINEINSNICSIFLQNNHIQGPTNPSKSFGIFYKDNLVGVMVFGKSSKLSGSNSDCWELKRFCTLLNTQIIGAAGKLLKYFVNLYHPTKIISFSSNDISNGDLYKSLGFTSNNTITSAYWYVDINNYKRHHRSHFQKSKLIEMGYSKNLSESQIMSELPYYKIYDSGHIKWNLNLI